tara:strand:- start:3669 stop:4844 length:1176 start_codon:yes stop_codon:yes gene_type:complete
MRKKINLLLPIAGKAQRFLDQGYLMPKPLIKIFKKKDMIDLALESIDTKHCNLIFIVRKSHIDEFEIKKILKKKFGKNISVIVSEKVTEGAVSTCLLAEKLIDNNDRLIIFTPDVYFSKKWNPKSFKNDGHLLTFKSISPDHSYAKLNKAGHVIKTAEKKVISKNAAVGVYAFKHGKDFVYAAKELIKNNDRYNNEFYICPTYNYLIKKDLKITTSEVEKMYVLGTPDDLKFYQKNVFTKFGTNTIGLCSDHSGINLKNKFLLECKKRKIKTIDFGCFSEEDKDYPDYVILAAKAIKNGVISHALGFCRSGQGVNITANKFKDIRSSIIFDAYTAQYAVEHNCSNFFSIPSKYVVTKEKIKKIIQILQNASFDGGRHKIRIEKISEIESLK